MGETVLKVVILHFVQDDMETGFVFFVDGAPVRSVSPGPYADIVAPHLHRVYNVIAT